MSAPEPVMRGGRMVYEVPELRRSSCFGCRWFDNPASECMSDDFESVAVHCVASPIIFIDATPLALAEYALAKE